MNFLAHCHIAHITDTSYVGNLLGDFVKGPISSLDYSKDILNGIQLHRAVDTYTDQHPFTKHLKTQLGSHRRYGGIVLDVFFDHQLAINFEQIDQQSLNEFSQHTYQQLARRPENVPARFHRIVQAMTAGDWLTGYQHLQNIERALDGIDSRLKKPANLSQTLNWYQPRQKQITNGFLGFYDDLFNFSLNFSQKL